MKPVFSSFGACLGIITFMHFMVQNREVHSDTDILPRSSLIRIYTVCPDLPVRKLRIITVNWWHDSLPLNTLILPSLIIQAFTYIQCWEMNTQAKSIPPVTTQPRPWENVSYAICEQQRHRSACTSAQSDHRLCCSLPRQNDTSSLYIGNFKILAGFCSLAGQFVSCLVRHSWRHIFSWRGSRFMKFLNKHLSNHKSP